MMHPAFEPYARWIEAIGGLERVPSLAEPDAGLIALLRAWQWHALFWQARDVVAQRVTAIVIGHGLLDKLRTPFRALTAQALIVENGSDADTAAASQVQSRDFVPHRLSPVPVAALPGWDSERIGERLFDDRDVFRLKH